MHAEAGGESIDENHHDLLALIARFGLRTERRAPLKPYDAAVYRGGTRTRLPLLLAEDGGAALDDILAFDDVTAAMAEGIDPAHPERAVNAAALDARSLESLIREQNFSPTGEFIIRTELRGLYNAEPRDISLLFVLQQAAQAALEEVTPVDSLIGVETMRIAGGNSLLPSAMADALQGRVRTGSPLARVEHRGDGVHVHTSEGGQPIDAAWLIVATPMQPLRRVTFEPALPGALGEAVAGLDLGHAVKVIHEYEVPFWTAEGFSGFTVTDLPFGVAWSPTDSRVTYRALLTQFVAGDAAAPGRGDARCRADSPLSAAAR